MSVFGDVPDAFMLAGSAIIVAAGLYIFWREQIVGAARAGLSRRRRSCRANRARVSTVLTCGISFRCGLEKNIASPSRSKPSFSWMRSDAALSRKAPL